MSKSFDKIDGKKVREQYFRSERRQSQRKGETVLEAKKLLKYPKQDLEKQQNA